MIPLDREEVVHARALLVAAERAILAEYEHAGDDLRGHLAAELFTVRKMLGDAQLSFAQAGQDLYLDTHVFHGRCDGVFVEAGGFDGVKGSNTLFFETFRGWTGLLVEPVPYLADAARRVRRVPCVTAALGADTGDRPFLNIRDGYTLSSGLLDTIPGDLLRRLRAHPQHREEIIKVPVRPLHAILDDAGLDKIDYLSLDIEGGEVPVLRAFPFSRFEVLVWTIENNTGDGIVAEIMNEKGYILADFLLVDEVYIREDLYGELCVGETGKSSSTRSA